MYVEVLFAPSLTFSSLIINYVTKSLFLSRHGGSMRNETRNDITRTPSPFYLKGIFMKEMIRNGYSIACRTEGTFFGFAIK